MHNKRLSKTPSSINTNSQTAEQNPKLAYRSFDSQIQKSSAAPVTQSKKEDVAFAEQKMEATRLELQAKYGKITPEGQERLIVLQAKMDGLLNSQLQHARRFSHNIANIPLTRPDIAAPIQAKLTIGEPGDKYEQEADKIAAQVVQRIHQPQSEKLQRESLPEEEKELQMKPSGSIQRESLPDAQQELQMKPMVQRRASNSGMAGTQDFEAALNQTRGGGQPMEKNYREKIEQGFGGADFSKMKIHTDSQADQLSRSIGALAFTHKNHVYFRGGTYNPGTKKGDTLITHEFTHGVQNGAAKQGVVQQNGGAIQRLQDTIQRRVGFEFENLQHTFIKSNPNTFETYYQQHQGDVDLKEKIQKNFEKPKRKEVIIQGADYTLEADDTRPGFATLEFVVPDKDGFNFDQRQQLIQAVKKVQNLAKEIENAGQQEKPFLMASKLSVPGKANVVIIPGVDHRYVVQATGGIGITKLTNVISHDDNSQLNLGVQNKSGKISVNKAKNAIASVASQMQNFPNNGREKLTNLFSLMVLYITGSQRNESNFKNITPLMARTSFVRLFNEIDQEMKEYLRRTPDAWKNLVNSAFSGETIPTAFEHYSNDDDDNDDHYLEIEDWIRSFTQESGAEDKLNNFDTSMGQFENRVDRGRQNQAQPIFEFRNLPPAPPEQFLERAEKFFDYVNNLNGDTDNNSNENTDHNSNQVSADPDLAYLAQIIR
ncbi:MAG: DUF4157 domain-containing protein [Nostoc sp.]|uniref:eCIS core domain-containing protein n=1 Tax=Nostoc sp. TaxID=1180 RepID=UPI002FF489AD